MADIIPDPQDPLPEANWFWRRVFVFACATAILFLVYGAVDRLGAVAVVKPEVGIPAFVSIVKLLIFTVNALILFYMIAPSAEQITKMLKTASLLKAGVQFTSRATVDERATAAGKPPLPQIAPGAGQETQNQAPGYQDTPEAPETLPDAPWAAVHPLPPPSK